MLNITKNHKKIYILTALFVLSFSTILPAVAFAAPLGGTDKDWQHMNANSWAQNYSPQTQINKNNVDNLEIKWLFPIGSKVIAPTALQSLTLNEGVNTPPIVRNGVVYMTTNFLRTYAVDAKTGKQLWANDYTVNVTDIRNRIPVILDSAGTLHGINYWESGDAVLVNGIGCDFYGINAKTGTEKFRVKDYCLNIEGNLPFGQYVYRQGMSAQNNIGLYEKGRQFIVVAAGYMHSSLRADGRGDARHATMGISMDPPYNILWKVYSSPPKDRLAKDWALEECNIGFFAGTPCSEVAAKNRAGLEWDFGLPNEKPSKWGGVTQSWGQFSLDEDTGILYMKTGNQGPYSNMSLAPGPRLYGSTIMAIDMNKGKRIWWLQPFPHDPYDYDCNWNGILAESSTLGKKLYVAGCKEGILYAMDAATGKPAWTKDIVAEQVTWGQIGPAATKQVGEGGVKYRRPDPTSYYDMREWNWISYPATKPGDAGKYCTLPCDIYPFWSNGIFATDLSYDPEKQTLIHYAIGLQVTILQENPYALGKALFTTRTNPIANTTIVARDLATGQVKWTWFYKTAQQRSHLVVTGGMVYTGFTDGMMKFFDKDTGTLLKEVNLGSAIWIGPSIGKDSSGDSKIFVIAQGGVTSGARTQTPGTLIALGLSGRTAQTVTTTSVTTTTSTTTSVSTTTSATTTTVTTTSATTSTVTSTSATTATSTVVSTQPARTTTVTSQITQTTGLPSEVTYAAVAVAIIAIIAAAVLTTRKKT